MKLFPIALFSCHLVVACGGGGGGAHRELAFHGSEPFLDSFEHDTGLVPDGSPAQVRIVATGEGGVDVNARASASGGVLTPEVGSGSIALSGRVALQIYAKLDVSGVAYDGLVHETSYEIPSIAQPFEPFLVGGEAPVEAYAELPPAEIARVPIPSVPGSTLVVNVTGGFVSARFRGTCAAILGDEAQYLGHLELGGTIELEATIEVSVPLLGDRSFGPLGTAIALPTAERALDLGTVGLASGTRSDSTGSHCGAVDDGGIVADAGTPPPDARDAGVSAADAGPGRDAGTIPRDGGSARDAGTCSATELCGNGVDDDCDGSTDEDCPEYRLGAATYALPSYGGGLWSGPDFALRCPAGYAYFRMSGRAGSRIDQIRPSCARLLSDGSIDLATATSPGSAGGTGGEAFGPYTCPDGGVAVGLHGRSGARIDAIGMICADVRTWAAGSSVTDDLPSSGGTGGSRFRATCPTGYLLTEIRGRAGDLVDGISGTCRFVVR